MGINTDDPLLQMLNQSRVTPTIPTRLTTRPDGHVAVGIHVRDTKQDNAKNIQTKHLKKEGVNGAEFDE